MEWTAKLTCTMKLTTMLHKKRLGKLRSNIARLHISAKGGKNLQLDMWINKKIWTLFSNAEYSCQCDAFSHQGMCLFIITFRSLNSTTTIKSAESYPIVSLPHNEVSIKIRPHQKAGNIWQIWYAEWLRKGYTDWYMVCRKIYALRMLRDSCYSVEFDGVSATAPY